MYRRQRSINLYLLLTLEWFQETIMAKLDQKFSKGSKSKHKFDFEDDFQDFDLSSKKKKRRTARQRDAFPEYDDSY